MTQAQIRPRIEPDLAVLIQAWADRHHVSFNAAVNALCSIALALQTDGLPTAQPKEIQR
jgi:hypothetical protein